MISSVRDIARIITVVLCLTAGLMVHGCSDEGPDSTDTFDRSRMLTQFADQVIVPSYDDVCAKATDLVATIDTFRREPTEQHLEDCRTAWLQTAISWQHVVSFDFGPAEGPLGNLSVNVGTFPASPDKIEAAIDIGDTTLQNFDRDGRGLFAIDYLLFNGTASAVVNAFTSESFRFAYLSSVARRLVSELTTVRNTWTTSYRDDFVSRSGTDAGSGTSLLFNHMNIGYELAKNYKLGLPLGRIAGQTAAEPTKVEAFYSTASIKLLREHYNAVVNIWYGRTSNGTDILGFRDYLLTVPNGQRLIDDTEAQLLIVQGAWDALSDDEVMSDLILSDPTRLETLHTEMQKLTRFFKSELSSLIGISITYSSGDGD